MAVTFTLYYFIQFSSPVPVALPLPLALVASL